jgi:hypothetical protein
MGWLQRLLESGHAVRANFNRAAYNAQNQPFASRFNRGCGYFDKQEKAGPSVPEPALQV